MVKNKCLHEWEDKQHGQVGNPLTKHSGAFNGVLNAAGSSITISFEAFW